MFTVSQIFSNKMNLRIMKPLFIYVQQSFGNGKGNEHEESRNFLGRQGQCLRKIKQNSRKMGVFTFHWSLRKTQM